MNAAVRVSGRPLATLSIAILVASLVIAGCAAPGTVPTATSASTSSQTIPPPSTAPTSTNPAQATPDVQILGTGGNVFPGRYRTHFAPAMLLTVTDVVDLDCAPGYECRGDIDVNLPNWVGFEFGNINGSQLDITRLDKVYASDGKTLVVPPADAAAWFGALPAFTQLAAPVKVTVGGVAGTRFDVTAKRVIRFGPTGLPDPADFGINGGAGSRAWITVLTVDGHLVMISESIGVENTVLDFDAVTDGLQGVIDSITWG